MCHRIPNFIGKATNAGVRRVFIGLESINPDNLLAAKKRQNRITEYRAMLQKWHEHGAITYAGYIIGFPGDTKESILRDIEILKRELPIDVLELFMLTPLPGSEDHKVATSLPDSDEFDRLDLYHATAGGEAALARKRREDTLRAGVGRTAPIAAAD